MTEAPDSSPPPERSGAPDGAPAAPERSGSEHDLGPRLDVEADPLDELRRRQYEAREAREREARRREQEQRDHEARVRQERRRKREEVERQAREEAARRRARKEAARAEPEAPASSPARPAAEPAGAAPETRPLPSVESSATEAPPSRPPEADPPGADRPEPPPVRKPAERPGAPGLTSPGTSIDAQLPTRPVERSLRPEPAPAEPPKPQPEPARPRPPAPEPEPAMPPPTQATPAATREMPATPETAAGDEAAIPRLSAARKPGSPVRHRLTGIDVRSIFKLALVFYLGVLGAVVAGGTSLWFLLTSAGVIGNLESFVGELLGYEEFEFIFSRIFVVSVLVGLVWVVVSAGLTALFAFIYNRATRFTGGLEFTFDDDA